MHYKKKPVEIEAVLWEGNQLAEACPHWLAAALLKKPGETGSVIRCGDEIHIFTLEGKMVASAGDYIIQGVAGEIYPCKPGIFAQTYEAIKNPVPQDTSLQINTGIVVGTSPNLSFLRGCSVIGR